MEIKLVATLDFVLEGHSGVTSQTEHEDRMTDVGEVAAGSSSTSHDGMAATQYILAIPRT
jgi:hypothetical protein